MRRRKDVLITLAYCSALAALFYLTARYLLSWLLPFLAALVLSAAVEPIVAWCRRIMRLKRSFVAAVLTLLLTVGVSALLIALVRRLWVEILDVLNALPALLRALPALADTILDRLEVLRAACPAAIRQWIEQGSATLSAQLTQAVTHLSADAVAWVADKVKLLPEAALFCVTTALALFFSISSYPQVRAFVRRQIGPQHLETAKGIKGSVAATLLKWSKAQLILLTVTFGQLLTAFLLLRQPYALLLALLIALIDALPVFGAGTVLLPWAFLCFLQENVARGFALCALCAVITLVRSVLEPKVMATQAGLTPLASLLALYLGFRVFGVAGMVLFPLLLLLLAALRECGVVRLWR